MLGDHAPEFQGLWEHVRLKDLEFAGLNGLNLFWRGLGFRVLAGCAGSTRRAYMPVAAVEGSWGLHTDWGKAGNT